MYNTESGNILMRQSEDIGMIEFMRRRKYLTEFWEMWGGGIRKAYDGDGDDEAGLWGEMSHRPSA